MRICIHRGSKQIGGSCVELENHTERLLVDLGLPLDAELPPTAYLPAIRGLDGSDPSLLGILVSHPHLDHFGLLGQISQSIPVCMGAASRRILTAAAPFLPDAWTVPPPGLDFQSDTSFSLGSFQITPTLMDHSAYDAYALMIECDGKRIIYSGDLRAHGRKAKLFEKLVHHPPTGIDTLLLEGSSLGRLREHENFPTEADIETELVQTFSACTGIALVHASAQNIDRLVSVFRACKRTGRRLIIDLYSASILEATGNLNLPQSHWPDVALFIPQSQRVQIKNNAWFDLLKRHSINRIFPEELALNPEKSVLLFRPLHCPDLGKADCLKGAVYIYSQWEGYWDSGSYDNLKKWLDRHLIPKISIHTSGHASLPDLQRLVAAIQPRCVVPIHTFQPEMYRDYYPNVEIHPDGEWWEV